MTKRARDMIRKIERLGFTIVDLTTDGREHFRFTLATPTGRAFRFSMPYSASDWRSEKNAMARLKRELRLEENPT